jgi:hypothetical protein
MLSHYDQWKLDFDLGNIIFQRHYNKNRLYNGKEQIGITQFITIWPKLLWSERFYIAQQAQWDNCFCLDIAKRLSKSLFLQDHKLENKRPNYNSWQFGAKQVINKKSDF